MKLRELFEYGRIVKGVNTTVDVGPNEIKTQAAKFGNSVDKDGRPPTLSKQVKGKSTNVLFNLGLTEGKFRSNDVEEFKPSDAALDNLKSKYLPDWEMLDHRTIQAKYVAKDHRHAEQFVKFINRLSEKMDHFAEVTQDVAEVAVKTSTFDVKGLTLLDFQLAMIVDDFAEKNDIEQVRMSGNFGMHEKWSAKYKRSIDCSNPKGFSQKAHCAGRKKSEDQHPNDRPLDPETKPTYNTENEARSFAPQVTPLQSLVNEYLFFSSFGTMEAPGDAKSPDSEAKLNDVITKLAQSNKSLQSLDKQKLEANRDKILNHIHDMMKYAIAHLREHLPPEKFDEKKKQINSVLTKYNAAASTNENFADGKKPGRKGLAKRSGVNTKASVSSLRKTAKNSTGEKQRMAHWLANMKAGKAKKK